MIKKWPNKLQNETKETNNDKNTNNDHTIAKNHVTVPLSYWGFYIGGVQGILSICAQEPFAS